MNTNNGILQGITTEQIRTGDIHIDDIGNIILGIIEILKDISMTLCIIIILIMSFKFLLLNHGNLKEKKKLLGVDFICIIGGCILIYISGYIFKII